MKKYDVAIIGAGTAGLSARQEVAKKTDRYVVIDPGPLGTTCARVGCMPSKAFIQTANDYHCFYGNTCQNQRPWQVHTGNFISFS